MAEEMAGRSVDRELGGKGAGPVDAAHVDIVILGGGLAGTTLARHLLLDTEFRVTILDRAQALPTSRQKYGESSVQVAGHYYGKVLELEELLFHEHFMKYNLRFYWKTPGLTNAALEDYSQSYIRNFSNVPSYQLDRNAFEKSVLDLNLQDPRFELVTGISGLQVDMGEGGAEHSLRYVCGGEPVERTCTWFVDTTGRNRWLARQQGLRQGNDIHHGASFLWVDGLVDIEKLTGLTREQRRRNPQRAITGHLPQWLATNHFMGEGFWFWVIPLQGKTSLGLVYEHGAVDASAVDTPEKLIEWVCREFPLFARDLPQRRIVDHGRLRDYSHGCARTIHPDRWAIVGEAGRFSDPLYSPGSDLISTYNTLLVDAIRSPDEAELKIRCQRGETMMRSLYEAYVPSYAVSYDALGDHESFTLKYSWELAIYFAFYVFPFINGMLTDRLGSLVMMRRFAQLGELNARMQQFLSDYTQWKKTHGWLGLPDEETPREAASEPRAPRFQELSQFPALAAAAETFYEMDGEVTTLRRVLSEQLESLEQMGKAVFAWVAAQVLDDPALASDARFVEGLEESDFVFCPEGFARRREQLCAGLSIRPQGSGAHRLAGALDFLEPFAEELRQRRAATEAGSLRAAEPRLAAPGVVNG